MELLGVGFEKERVSATKLIVFVNILLASSRK